MRLALFGAALAVAAFSAFSHVTYLNTGGFSADWAEHRRIDVVSATACAEILQRAERTLGAGNGLRCEPVPLYRHWFNLARASYEQRGLMTLASTLFGGEALASAAAPAPSNAR
ncbi:hypothetical protein [Hansschlegelia beijingensis]|uniref:Uncharacterized protein n=1 Tax=Hansschlegelia beijingensis TaxID=1133344 RepID=A0A7W6CX49_9HYPH|nr:hypothetical protein [Hansschlegelia beijingensis]MBB3971872.1 hypothetical protein [Hansschlegelia beijingensis]